MPDSNQLATDQKPNDRPRADWRPLGLACLGLSAAIFALDTQLPVGLDTAVLYVLVVLVALRSRSPRLISAVMATSLALAWLGVVVPTTEGVSWIVLTNRALASVVIVGVAAMSLRRIVTFERQVEERRRNEAELTRRARRLEQLNQELDGFTYSVSHDLRAPLRAIDGFVRILVEDYADVLDDEGRRVAGVIRRNVDRMGQLIDELLTLSRLGKRTIEPAPVDMTAAARAALDDAMVGAEERPIEIDIDELPPCWGEATLLRQVFANLLLNAVKFTRGRQPARIHVTGEHDNGEVTYAVEDNGVGFDMHYADKLFGVFERLHKASEFEGTGVGLAVVKRIVTRHGGRVWAEGAIDEGATFRFALPARAEDRS